LSEIVTSIARIKKTFFEKIRFIESHPRSRYFPAISMGLLLVLLVTFMFPSIDKFQFADLKEGNVYTGDEIIAPFTFFVNKTQDEINRDRKAATQKIPLVFTRVDSIQTKSLQEFEQFYNRFYSTLTSTTADSNKTRILRDILNEYSILIEPSNISTILTSQNSSKTSNRKTKSDKSLLKLRSLRQELLRILVDSYTIGILNLGPDDIPDYVKRISLVTSQRESVENLSDFYNQVNYKDVILEKLRQTFPDQKDIVKLSYPILIAFLKPNIIYDKTETDNRINEAVSNVPLSKDIVLESERILNKHEIITKDILEKLNSLAANQSERQLRSGGINAVLPYLGRFLTIAVALSFLLLFIYFSRKQLFFSWKKMFMVYLIFLIVLSATFLVDQFELAPTIKFLIPVSIASMLLTIFFDARFAFIGTVSLSIMVGLLRGNDFDLMVVSLFAGTISTFFVREIQARSWMIKAILSISFAYFLSIGSLEILKHSNFSNLTEMWLYGGINGLFSPILAYALMIIFEYVFQLTTNSTLLELSDLNKPLLRELAIRSPGTYHHSIMVGNLSEAAAEAIGANALLARVASYYHDIGKMEKPEYFVENQKGGKNPHEKLTPSMSCLILINHVKRGLEIAEEYNLPQEIKNFIPEHHGTNLIKYFFQKAKESKDESEINEDAFRYHGPKPQSKESGIVMLADSVEAGSRTLKDPTVGRIRNMVSMFIQERLLESELDECPLTVKDLKLVNESFVNSLTGIFHGRIEYPSHEKRPAKTAV